MTILERTLALPPRRQARWLGIGLMVVVVVTATRLAPAVRPTLEDPPGVISTDRAALSLPGDMVPASGATGLVPPDERIAFWEPRVAADPRDYLSALHLADAYLDRARATADLADLQRAEAVLAQAAVIAPDPLLVVPRQAQVAFSLHDFARAAALADEVLAGTPDDLAALAVAGDARLETGDLTGARQHYDRLATLAPSAPVWSRLARLAFLEAKPDLALALVERAIGDAEANGFAEEGAFYRYQLGELHRASGDLASAATAYESALAASPGHPAATVGLAMVREGQDRRGEAIALLEDATSRVPTPEAVAALGDLYLLTGDGGAADRQYALVERIGEVAQATGSVYDRQLVLFAADHDRNVFAAVAAARAELEVRQDIYAWDALAWALFRAGRLDEAAEAAAHALVLGTPDPRLAYHGGMIAAARGETEAARQYLTRALEGAAYLPPLQVPIAQGALAALDGVQSQVPE
ncbi:MAG: tetratricopeptide repeat protein [Candidatus Limnocylindria bacterium]